MTSLPSTLIDAATAVFAHKVTQEGMGRPADQRRAAMESFTAALQFQKELEATDIEGLGR